MPHQTSPTRSSRIHQSGLDLQSLRAGVCLLSVAGLLALAGCSSTKMQVDTGPIAARTFSFMGSIPRPAPSYADNTQQVHALVQQAITRTLAAKGVSSSPQGGDLTVAYLVIAGNNATTTSLNEYFGYGDEAAALTQKVHKEQALKSESRGYFEAGTLVIDLLDARSGKLLKRASVQSQILRNLPAETRTTRLQGFVDQALADLRIAK